MIFILGICPVIGVMTFYYLHLSTTAITTAGADVRFDNNIINNHINTLSFIKIIINILWSSIIAYIPTYIYTYYKSKKDGKVLKWLQRSRIWLIIRDYFQASIEIEDNLDHSKQYIFCNFPHGACTVGHALTMTDCCGMLSQHHRGDRRDLSASILFLIPIVKDILLFLGCVDASAVTAHYNLKRGRSILIFVGGEKEQLMTVTGQHKIYLNSRKGFVKLALQYGVDLIPMYTFGENETFTTYSLFSGFREWLQTNFQIGIPIFSGRYGIFPYPAKLKLEIGKPIPVTKKDNNEISQEDIDSLHTLFINEMIRLFNRTKERNGIANDVKLQIC